MSKDKPHGVKSPYLIHCVKDEDFGSCGASSYLTEEQYINQMKDADRGWRCPICNCYPCDWDDDNYDEHMNQEQE